MPTNRQDQQGTTGQGQGRSGTEQPSDIQSFDTDRSYWQDRYTKEPYYEAGRAFSDYEPGYRVGHEGYQRYGGRFEDNESSLESDYARMKGNVSLAWDKAKSAARAAWHRLERAMPGDADRDDL